MGTPTTLPAAAPLLSSASRCSWWSGKSHTSGGDWLVAIAHAGRKLMQS